MSQEEVILIKIRPFFSYVVSLFEATSSHSGEEGGGYYVSWCTPVETLEDQIQELQPLVLLTNIESLNDSGIQRMISKLKLSYIAIDKAQVFCRSMTTAESLSIFTQPTSLNEGTD